MSEVLYKIGLFLIIAIKVLFNSVMVYLFFGFAPNIPYILLDIEPNSYNLTLPQTFDGPLRANNKLSEADHLFVNEILGPESLAIWKGDVYTGLSDGRIVRIRNERYKTVAQFGDPEKCMNSWEIEKCGRPLGMRFDSKGMLYVADAYYGLHTVNVTSGQVKRILTSKKTIEDRKPKFIDDLVINEEEEAIYFTDASDKWDLKNVFFTVGEHDESGRVIRYDMKTKNSTVIMKSLGFPNGIELTDDKSALLVCEFNNRRIMRHYIDGDKRGQTDVYAFNLPGEPDNIRRSSDPYVETYWVALAMGRNDKNPSFALDHLSRWPKTRKALLRAMNTLGTGMEFIGKMIGFSSLTELGFKTKTGAIMYHTITHYGMAIELDNEGKIVQSLHSPDGKTSLLSEVREVVVGDRKVLYLGSFANNYIGKLTLGTLMQLHRPLITHEKKQFIEQKKQKMGTKSKPKKYKPYKPFDLQNPHFGPQNDAKQQDFANDNDFSKFKPKSTKKTKKKTKSKTKTSKKKSKSKTKQNKLKSNKKGIKSEHANSKKTKPDSKVTESPKSESTKPELVKPEPTKPESIESESTKSEAIDPDSSKSKPIKPEFNLDKPDFDETKQIKPKLSQKNEL